MESIQCSWQHEQNSLTSVTFSSETNLLYREQFLINSVSHVSRNVSKLLDDFTFGCKVDPSFYSPRIDS